MSVSKSSNTSKVKDAVKAVAEVEVLYQRLGERWYAFSLIGDEVFVGQVDPNQIEQVERMGQISGAISSDAPPVAARTPKRRRPAGRSKIGNA